MHDNSNIINGNEISLAILHELKSSIAKSKKKPGLAVVQVGADPASTLYVEKKRETCASIGMQSFDYNLPADVTETKLKTLITELNQNELVNGIMVQLPLPKNLNSSRICSLIAEHKDVDGLSPISLGNIITNDTDYMTPCTPQGIMLILTRIKAQLTGANIVIVGASTIVGKPLAMMLINQKATVTICHKDTRNLAPHIESADILISAIGKTNVIKSAWIKPNAIVIDIGINKVNDTVVGDIDFNSAQNKASWITPVPGGIGPVTVAMLMLNTFKAFQKNS
jgi:methylenetetrahydrofolate dehydrogenase (NADP+) / methenyltetrahydrofolate cyclohydrolase